MQRQDTATQTEPGKFRFGWARGHGLRGEKVWERVLAADDLVGSLCHELLSEISQPACGHPRAQSYNRVSRLAAFLPSY